MLLPKWIYPKCIFAKCTRLACLLLLCEFIHCAHCSLSSAQCHWFNTLLLASYGDVQIIQMMQIIQIKQIRKKSDNTDRFFVRYFYLLRIFCEILLPPQDSSQDITISTGLFVRFFYLISILCEIFLYPRDSSCDCDILLSYRYAYQDSLEIFLSHQDSSWDRNISLGFFARYFFLIKILCELSGYDYISEIYQWITVAIQIYQKYSNANITSSKKIDISVTVMQIV